MADHARRQSRSVEEQLFEDASRFTFLQAVRLMEDIALGKGLNNHRFPGEAVHHEQELLFFRHNVRLDIPSSDVESLRAGRRGGDGRHDEPPTMLVNVLGLAGVLGPLPQTVTETILHELRRGDRAFDDLPVSSFSDFLDIFNHRLISLLYRARKKYRPALDPRGPHEGRVSRVLYSILGLGTPHLKGRLLGETSLNRPFGQPSAGDRLLLPYTGLFAERYRSPIGLERILADAFGTPATVTPFVGAWETIEDSDRTAIGTRLGRNQRLGHAALAGRRIWNQAARFEVSLGPLKLEQFRSFLPVAENAYRPLVSLIRFYAHEELGFSIRLILDRNEIPELELKRGGSAHLGQTTWLARRRPFAADDTQVRLTGSA
jgi:type VI secretion system protein ImpH